MPSPAASKAKGAKFEGELRDWMQENCIPIPDQIAMEPGWMMRPLVVEAKAEKRYDIPAYVREAKKEMANAGADHWMVVMRKRGSTDVGETFVVLDLREWLAQTNPKVTQVERIRLSGTNDRGDLSGVFL